jgi:hypothetical protein
LASSVVEGEQARPEILDLIVGALVVRRILVRCGGRGAGSGFPGGGTS